MDLGLGFEDSDFERKKKTTAGTKTSYNAKVCKPLWFEHEDEADPSNYYHQLKFSADYHFHQGSYDTAVPKYLELLDLIPETNMPMRQDVQESLCRSYTKLSRHKESIDIAYKLVERMREEDEARQKQSLLLLSQACKGAQDWTGCISALEELASQQKFYSPFWLELGRAYRQNYKDRGDSHDFLPQIVLCFVRARLHNNTNDVIPVIRAGVHMILLESVLSTVGHVAREKNVAAVHKIDAELQELSVSQELVNLACEATKADIAHSISGTDEEENYSICLRE